VPENEGLDSDASESPLPEFLSNPDVRFEVSPADRAALRAALEQLRTALKRATINSESSGFTASRSAPGLMPAANASALAGMRMSRMSGSSPVGGGGGGLGGSVASMSSLGLSGAGAGAGGAGSSVLGLGAAMGAGAGAAAAGDAAAGGDAGRLGKQFGSGLPSLLACLKGLKRAGTGLSERHFFCYVVRVTGGAVLFLDETRRAVCFTAALDRAISDCGGGCVGFSRGQSRIFFARFFRDNTLPASFFSLVPCPFPCVPSLTPHGRSFGSFAGGYPKAFRCVRSPPLGQYPFLAVFLRFFFLAFHVVFRRVDSPFLVCPLGDLPLLCAYDTVVCVWVVW